jgi:hypothetical protein
MNTGLFVGVNPESVKELRASIMDILNAPYVDSKVKLKALDTLSQSCSVTNTTISNCEFIDNSPTKRR